MKTLCAALAALVFVSGALAADPTLTEARKGFKTTPKASAFETAGPIPAPPANLYSLVRYSSPAGKLAALLTPDPNDGKRHPAVVWCHGGFGGIGSYYWEPQPAHNDQTPKAFVDAGFVVMLPSWRGENDNPGRFELFFGEVDDAMAAVDHVRSLKYVDPDRVYMVGHSTGGTIAMLCALASNGDGRLRAVVAFGGTPDVNDILSGWSDMIPFDAKNRNEVTLRSAATFIRTLKTPLWTIEGSQSANLDGAVRMSESVAKLKLPHTNAVVDGATHYSLLRPVTRLLAERWMREFAEGTPAELGAIDCQKAFDVERAARRARLAKLPLVRITPAAANTIRKILAQSDMKPGASWVHFAGGKLDLVEEFDASTREEVTCEGLRVAINKSERDDVRGTVIDFDAAGNGFVIRVQEQ